MLTILPSGFDKSVETTESHTASCHLEINQLGFQDKAVFILSLQLNPFAIAAQTLDDTGSSSHGIIFDFPFTRACA